MTRTERRKILDEISKQPAAFMVAVKSVKAFDAITIQMKADEATKLKKDYTSVIWEGANHAITINVNHKDGDDSDKLLDTSDSEPSLLLSDSAK